jgi:alkaline phosphatase
MYAQEVYRNDYQDLAREMPGLPGIIQEVRHAPRLPGLDVIMGTGFGIATNPKSLAAQGRNGVLGSQFITDADLTAIDVENGGKYMVVCTQPGTAASRLLENAAAVAAHGSGRLFAFFGRTWLDHLPYQTTDGRYDPVPSLDASGGLSPVGQYTTTDRLEQPSLALMTDAALAVRTAKPN